MYVTPRYVFDLNQMQFIFPSGERPYGPFKISLVFNGININEELENLKFQKYVLQILIAQTEDEWERVHLEETIYNLDVQKDKLLQNLLRYLQQFWDEMEQMSYDIRCPKCGRISFIQYLIYFDQEVYEDEYDEDEYEEYEEEEDEEEDMMIKMGRCTSAAG